MGRYGGYWVDTHATVRIDTRPDVKDAEVRYTLDLTEPARTATLYSEPFVLNEPTIVKAKVFGKNGESMSMGALYRMANTQAGNGLNYTVYHCPDATIMPKSFDHLKPVAKGTCFEIGFHTPENNYDTGIDEAISRFKDRLGMVYDGWLEIDDDKLYTFGLWSTGGSRLYIGNELVVTNSSNGHTGNEGQIELKKGRYPIRVEFFHNDQSLGSILMASYEARGMAQRLIPAQKLFKTK
jgi:hypothetical protein